MFLPREKIKLKAFSKYLAWKLKKAFHLTIFGYSGPATDYSAINLLIDGWKQTPGDISHVEIIELDLFDPNL